MEVKEVLKVKDSALFAVHPESLLSEAVIMMAENDIGCVVVMDGGIIIESGPPETIFTNPTQERTRGFLQAVLSRA